MYTFYSGKEPTQSWITNLLAIVGALRGLVEDLAVLKVLQESLQPEMQRNNNF